MAVNEITTLASEALAELEAMPVSTSYEVAESFARFARVALSGQPVAAAGFNPRDTPALYRLWRRLPATARMALMVAALGVADGLHAAAKKAGEDAYAGLMSGIRSLLASSESGKVEEREPTPTSLPPPLLTPSDAVCKDPDKE